LRLTRRSLLIGSGALASCIASPACARPPAASEPVAIDIRARPIERFALAGGERRLGALTFRSGLELTSDFEGRIGAAAIEPGAVLDGPVIFEADAGHEIDNMEGIAVHRDGGATVVSLVSDDNFSRLQRTLLLEFALDG
jgi:hypothetical protein